MMSKQDDVSIWRGRKKEEEKVYTFFPINNNNIET
jgi:hypothetical protein